MYKRQQLITVRLSARGKHKIYLTGPVKQSSGSYVITIRSVTEKGRKLNEVRIHTKVELECTYNSIKIIKLFIVKNHAYPSLTTLSSQWDFLRHPELNASKYLSGKTNETRYNIGITKSSNDTYKIKYVKIKKKTTKIVGKNKRKSSHYVKHYVKNYVIDPFTSTKSLGKGALF